MIRTMKHPAGGHDESNVFGQGKRPGNSSNVLPGSRKKPGLDQICAEPIIISAGSEHFIAR